MSVVLVHTCTILKGSIVKLHSFGGLFGKRLTPLSAGRPKRSEVQGGEDRTAEGRIGRNEFPWQQRGRGDHRDEEAEEGTGGQDRGPGGRAR